MSAEKLKRLAITWSTMKNHKLQLVWKHNMYKKCEGHSESEVSYLFPQEQQQIQGAW